MSSVTDGKGRSERSGRGLSSRIEASSCMFRYPGTIAIPAISATAAGTETSRPSAVIQWREIQSEKHIQAIPAANVSVTRIRSGTYKRRRRATPGAHERRRRSRAAGTISALSGFLMDPGAGAGAPGRSRPADPPNSARTGGVGLRFFACARLIGVGGWSPRSYRPEFAHTQALAGAPWHAGPSTPRRHGGPSHISHERRILGLLEIDVHWPEQQPPAA